MPPKPRPPKAHRRTAKGEQKLEDEDIEKTFRDALQPTFAAARGGAGL